MTLKEQIEQGEGAALEFKENRPKDALKFVLRRIGGTRGHWEVV